MKSVEISVIMSIYKEPLEWINSSINSILNQTFKDLELIIVNDNPTESKYQIYLECLISRDSRCIVINNDTNLGLTKSLNKGLEFASGNYIARIDADDIAYHDRLERQINFMKNNHRCVACGTWATLINEMGKKKGLWQVPGSYNDLRSSCLFFSPILHPSAMFKRVIDGKEVRYDETMRYAQDYALWATLICSHELRNIEEPLLFYRVSSCQISSKNNIEQSKCAIRTQMELFNRLYFHSTENIKKTISVITKNDRERLDLTFLYDSLKDFIKKNNNDDTINNKLLKKHCFVSICNYLPVHYGLMSSLTFIFRFSIENKVLLFYPLISLIYKKIFKSM